MKVRYPSEYPVELVKKQLARSPIVKGAEVKGVFISFQTDPYLPLSTKLTEPLIKYLVDLGIRVATSSKLGVSDVLGVKNGMTIVSLDRAFWKEFEHRAPSPLSRLLDLRQAHKEGEYTWLSLEPCPCPGIWKQDIHKLLKELNFVDLIVLGMWNYDPRSRTDEAREYYSQIVPIFRDFCLENGIRHYIKKDTLDFIGEKVND